MLVRLSLPLISLYCCWIFICSHGMANAQMLLQPPESTTAALGANATFSCRGEGTVLWQINNSHVRDESQVPSFANIQVFVPLPRDDFSELIVTATRVTNATLVIICVVDPGVGLGDLARSDPVQLLVYGEPNPPPDVSVRPDGARLVATWSEPFSLEGEQLSYVVSITNTVTGAQKQVTVNTTGYVLSEPIGERDCAEYQFTVFSKNSFSTSRHGVTTRNYIPTEPLIFRASDVRIDVSFTRGISATISFNSTDPCPFYPVISYTFTVTDKVTNSLITSIQYTNNQRNLLLSLNRTDGLLPNQAYELVVEAENSVGRTASEKIPFYTTGLQSSAAVAKPSGSITVTCIFATGASSTGCQVTVVMVGSLREVFSRNITRPGGAPQVIERISLLGLRIVNTLLHVQTVELLDSGEIGNIVFNSTVPLAGISTTTAETSFAVTTLSSERSQVPILDTFQYIIIGVVVGVFVLVLVVLIVIIVCILVLLKRRKKESRHFKLGCQ